MKITITLEEFAEVVGFWGGAKTNWDNYTEAERDYLEAVAAECELNSLTAVNDFIWFDAPELLEEYGDLD